MSLCPAEPKEIFIFTEINESEVEYESTLDFNNINSDLSTDTERRKNKRKLILPKILKPGTWLPSKGQNENYTTEPNSAHTTFFHTWHS